MASKEEASEIPAGWLSLETLCACTGLTEAEVKIRIERGEIEQLYRSGSKRYRLRRAEDVVGTSETAPEEAWRKAISAFKARKKGGFLSRLPTGTSEMEADAASRIAEDGTEASEDPQMRPWARHPGWFIPDFEATESPA